MNHQSLKEEVGHRKEDPSDSTEELDELLLALKMQKGTSVLMLILK